jgi:hypothetical protein
MAKPHKSKSKFPRRKPRRHRRRLIIRPQRTGISNTRLQRGLIVLREQKDIGAAAKAARTTVSKFKRSALRKHAILKRGKNWIVRRDLHRRILIYSDGREKTITVAGYRRARFVGKYLAAVRNFLGSNDVKYLDPFRDQGAIDVAGKRHPFETNPNTLYRLTSSADEAFEAVYRIIVS